MQDLPSEEGIMRLKRIARKIARLIGLEKKRVDIIRRKEGDRTDLYILG